MKTLIERASKLQADGIFLGGPAHLFEAAGRKQLLTLLSEGLYPDSKVLDIGCGCLRGGYWLIHFLDAGCYFGIEPNSEMLDAGINTLLEPGLADFKRPVFNRNPDFNFSVFGIKFDFFVARSIWTHTSKQQIQTMLDGFVSNTNPAGVFITSYMEPTLLKPDYRGAKWVGKSHESDKPGVVQHSFIWIRTECKYRGLVAEEIREEAYNFGNQTWLRIKRRTT